MISSHQIDVCSFAFVKLLSRRNENVNTVLTLNIAISCDISRRHATFRKHKKNIHFSSNRTVFQRTRTETVPNRSFSSKLFQNRTEFQKSIPHIPTWHHEDTLHNNDLDRYEVTLLKTGQQKCSLKALTPLFCEFD